MKRGHLDFSIEKSECPLFRANLWRSLSLSVVLSTTGCSGIAHLSAWWTNPLALGGVTPAIDPIGGRVFFYWIDAAGNACHGDPGTSGRLGPVAVEAFKPEALAAAQANTVVSPSELAAFQEAPFSLSSYDARGPHYAQFGNILWRARRSENGVPDGVCMKGAEYFGVPEIVQLECGSLSLHPVFGNASCHTQLQILPSPLSEPVETQDPAHCLTRQRPQPAETPQERAQLCIIALPHGTEVLQK